MTTPNIDELIDRLYDWHNTSAEQNRLDMQKAADLLQSQAERIKELELDLDVQAGSIEAVQAANSRLAAERDTLRAQLETIAATEPVGYAVPTFNFDNSVIQSVQYAGTVPLFTRPMPAQDVTELVEALKACLQCFDEMKGRKPSFVEDSIAMSKEALSKYKGAK